MTQFLSEQDYQQLQPRITDGSVRLSIQRKVAREFFLRVANQSVVAISGQSVLLKKLLIWLGVILAPLMFIAAAAFIIMEFAWMATLAVPLLGIFWAVIAGFTGEKGGFWLGSLAIAAVICLAYIMPREFAIPIMLTALSLWLHRLTYLLAQRWLQNLAGKSFGAFDMLIEHVEVIDG